MRTPDRLWTFFKGSLYPISEDDSAAIGQVASSEKARIISRIRKPYVFVWNEDPAWLFAQFGPEASHVYMDQGDIRTSAFTDRIEAIQERIVRACQRVGRNSEEITIVAVSKTFPIQAVEAAVESGLVHFGENKVQELVQKASSMPGIVEGGTVNWHLIGHLQRNKAKDVVARVDLFHALDSFRLATELDHRAKAAERVLPCMVQVNTSGEASKSGIRPEETLDLLRELSALEHLEVVGLMTIAAPAERPEDVRPEFVRLRRLRDEARSFPGLSSLELLSMGMSNDFEVALEEGATHVRIGSAIFGSRSYRAG